MTILVINNCQSEISHMSTVKKMDEDLDLAVALQLQEKFNSETSSKDMAHKKLGEMKPAQSSLVDTTWEYIDPTPDVHSMFQLFNNRFFWRKLSSVEVKWSNRMTSCAGMCCYEGRGGLCSVRLSAPLLKLRPRKDLIETLLHEMIHAYLFVTNNNRDRDGHGPEFRKHMDRINKEAGTKISVYHNFHEEVKFYQQHWWRCNGPCQSRPPYFGVVRRASNRAPGPNDFWWHDHRAKCGGTFIKIKEPESFKSKDSATAKKVTAGQSSNVGDIRSFFPTQGSARSSGTTFEDKNHYHSSTSTITGVMNNVVDFKQLGNKVSSKPQMNSKGETVRVGKNIEGSGRTLTNKGSGTIVVVTKDKKQAVPVSQNISTNKFVPFKGVGHVLGNSNGSRKINGMVPLGGNRCSIGSYDKVSSATKRTILPGEVPPIKNKVSPPKKMKENNSSDSGTKPFLTSPKSPAKVINTHNSLESSNNVIEILDSPDKNLNVQCPVCSNMVGALEINIHLDVCVESAFKMNSSTVHCPVCNEELEEAQLNQHLETCVNCVFSDEDDDDEEVGELGSKGDTSSKLYPCPCCMTWVEPELMNHHLDECLSSKLLSKYSDINNS